MSLEDNYKSAHKSFRKYLREVGRGFIEVHHLTPLNVFGCSHTVNVDDLRPLCSNCHSIIHRRKNGFQNPFTIDELETIIENAKVNHPENGRFIILCHSIKN